jgi:Ni/Co efflux regulator RcnB
MRSILTSLILAISVVSLPAISCAGSADNENGQNWRKQKAAQAAYQRKLKRQQEAADQLRADYLDPAGDYKAYPAWARAGLAPKNDGGTRF